MSYLILVGVYVTIALANLIKWLARMAGGVIVLLAGACTLFVCVPQLGGDCVIVARAIVVCAVCSLPHIGSNHTQSTLANRQESTRVSPTQLTLISPPKTMRPTNDKRTLRSLGTRMTRVVWLHNCKHTQRVCVLHILASLNECGHSTDH